MFFKEVKCYESKVIRVRNFAIGEVLLGGDAREVFEVVDHVRLVVVAAAVGQCGEAFARVLLVGEQRVLEPDDFEVFFWGEAHELLENPFVLLAAQAGSVRKFVQRDFAVGPVDQFDVLHHAIPVVFGFAGELAQ